jgi:hypothetical protein
LNSSPKISLLFNLIAIQAIIYILKEKREKKKKKKKSELVVACWGLLETRSMHHCQFSVLSVSRPPAAEQGTS